MINIVFALIAIAAAQDRASSAQPQIDAIASRDGGDKRGNATLAAEPVATGVSQPHSLGTVTPQINEAVIPSGLAPEPQTPSGKFTTATEVKPILNATKSNWVALRDDGRSDLLYVTHLWSWRCGLAGLALSVNDEPMQDWPLPACHTEHATPNAILQGDGAPYLVLKRGGVQSVTIQLVYDDLTREVARFVRSDLLID